MKTLTLLLAAAALSGAAYGQDCLTDFQRQMQIQEQARQVHEQLEEIQAQQREIEHDIFNRQLEEMNRTQRQNYLRQYLEDCE